MFKIYPFTVLVLNTVISIKTKKLSISMKAQDNHFFSVQNFNR